VTADILDLYRAFTDAELRADTSRLEDLLADDFRSIGEHGVVLDKSQTWVELAGGWCLAGIQFSSLG
jgi:hypothetical protein